MGNVTVKDTDMYSPVAFWRRSGDIHPHENNRIPEVDRAVRQFFMRKFMLDFKTERNMLGIEMTRKRRKKDVRDKPFSEIVEGGGEQNKKMRADNSVLTETETRKNSSVLNPTAPPFESGPTGGARAKSSSLQAFQSFDSNLQERSARESMQDETRERGQRSATTLGDFVVQGRSRQRRTRWSEEQRDEHFERVISDLPLEIQDSRRRDRAEKLERLKERTEEKARLVKEKQEGEKIKYRETIRKAYLDAKKKGDKDMESRYYGILARMGMADDK